MDFAFKLNVGETSFNLFLILFSYYEIVHFMGKFVFISQIQTIYILPRNPLLWLCNLKIFIFSYSYITCQNANKLHEFNSINSLNRSLILPLIDQKKLLFKTIKMKISKKNSLKIVLSKMVVIIVTWKFTLYYSVLK